MIKRDLMGIEVWDCSPEEAKKIWVEQPKERWRIWSNEEVDKYFLADAATIQAVIDKKKAKPGRY